MSSEPSRTHVYLLTKYVAAFAAISAIGCGGASKPPAMQTASAAVTPEAGGTVKLADDSVKLDVPPGAVDGNKTITMTTTDATAPQGITADSPILQFEPSGTVFKAPVTVTFTFKSAKDPVVFWSNATGGYDMIEGTVTGNSIAAPVMHFSTGFVGDRPMGGSATCAQGVQCTAGMTCGYGGTTMAGTGGGTSGGSHTGTMAGADASAPATDPGTGPTTSALSSSDPASGATCCSCGSDGKYHCGGTCTPPSAGADASAGGGTVGGSDGGTMSGGGGPTGLCMQGEKCQGGGAPCANASVGGACSMCTCGAAGTLECVPCDHNPGTGGQGGTMTTTCTQGASCAQGPASCGGTLQGICQTCQCDAASGMYKCAPCADAADGGAPVQGHDGGAGGTMTTGCNPGSQCNPGDKCDNGVQGAGCYACQCGGAGTYQCAPCGGGGAADAGAPMGGGTLPPDACMQGLKCPQPGQACMGLTVNGVCPKCMCIQNGTLACTQVACP